jgi:hypothetical protein
MYGAVLGASTTVVAAGAVAVLPNTGGNVLLNVAISLGAGLAVWGVAYAKAHVS